MNINRSAGILLHPTSLPGPDGIGDLGPEIFKWLDFIAEAGCQKWQILPLGPTGYGDSPYQCFSAFAGNPYLISPLLLLEEDLLKIEDFIDRPVFPKDFVDYGPAIIWKNTIIDRAFNNFNKSRKKQLRESFDSFYLENIDWLEDFTIFMAIKESYGGIPWVDWSLNFKMKDFDTIESFKQKHAKEITKHIFRQWIFFKQWMQVKDYAHKLDIKIVGDIPFVIAFDSADVWANPHLFHLDDNRLPTVVAGVPPDYFSKTGQLWGNPLYRWDIHKEEGYQWWLKRFKSVLNMVDIVRLDHFRGFEAAWQVPFGNPTAEIGEWVKGPGHDFFNVINKELGELPIIAEDLGVITDGVIDLRDTYNMPGMKILQFSFTGDPDDDFLPHNYPVNCYAYTGSHDNNTALGWYQEASERERDFCRRYLAVSGEDISWSLIRTLWQSVAENVLAPMQDILSLGSQARMNLPGCASGNWQWRMLPDAINDFIKSRLYETNFLYGRLPQKEKEKHNAALESELTGQVKPH